MYYNRLRVVPSALRHEVSIDDIEHAMEHALLIDHDFDGTDPPRTLVLGLDRAGNVLELIGVEDAGSVTVFHAMPARPAMLRLLG